MFGLFKRHDVEMSPEVRGSITDGGKPVAQIKVVRNLTYEGYENGAQQIAHTFTDDKGQFSFEQKIIQSRLPGRMFGANVPVLQAIYIEKDNPEDQNDHYCFLWSTSKSWHSIPPLCKLLLQLNADLQHKEVKHLIDAANTNDQQPYIVSSICQWQGELISTYFNNELIASYDEVT